MPYCVRNLGVWKDNCIRNLVNRSVPVAIAGDFQDFGPKTWAQQFGLSRQWFLCIALTAMVVFGLKTTLALRTMGTNDIVTFKQDFEKVDADGWEALYRDGVDSVSPDGKSYHHVQVFSHPPFMLHVLPVWRGLASLTGLPLEFWVRLTCSLADLG